MGNFMNLATRLSEDEVAQGDSSGDERRNVHSFFGPGRLSEDEWVNAHLLTNYHSDGRRLSEITAFDCLIYRDAATRQNCRTRLAEVGGMNLDKLNRSSTGFGSRLSEAGGMGLDKLNRSSTGFGSRLSEDEFVNSK